MRVKVTITSREALELITTSVFHDEDGGRRVAYNGDWTITAKGDMFEFHHVWSTEAHQAFGLVVPF